MTDDDRNHDLTRLLASTARAHHEATGGVNSDWAKWYASYLTGRIDPFVGHSPSTETIEAWLIRADEQHRADDPDAHWPSYYARLILDEHDRS